MVKPKEQLTSVFRNKPVDVFFSNLWTGFQYPHLHPVANNQNKNIETFRVNKQITAKELRVVDDQGENFGVMPLEAALKLAEEKGLDLIEIAPKVIPPVARIISFDKFRYQKEKEEKKKEKLSKTFELKQIQISLGAAKNDLEIKARKVEEFLAKGHPVTIMMRLRGREKYNKPFAFQKLQEFSKFITAEYKVLREPKIGGQGISVNIIKK